MAFWACARLQPSRARLALHCLGLAGFQVYYPRLRATRVRGGRKVELQPPLFPSYCFVWIELQWHAARWSPGTLGFIMAGDAPAPVPEDVIIEIRGRERGGLVELPKRPEFYRGARIRILRGPFTGHLAIYADMKPRERVAVLLSLLGSVQRVTLSKGDVEMI